MVFIYKREMSCPGTCAVPSLCHLTCVGAHDFSHAPLPLLRLDLGPPVPPHKEKNENHSCAQGRPPASSMNETCVYE